MIEIYLVRAENLQEKLGELLANYYPYEILKNPNGKPYMAANRIFFSVSHSGTRGIIAICNKPIGIDLELYKNRSREAVLSRFSERERDEIECERDFLIHWTARESFVKMKGDTLANLFKRMEYFNGCIYLDGVCQNCNVKTHIFGFGIAATCTED